MCERSAYVGSMAVSEYEQMHAHVCGAWAAMWQRTERVRDGWAATCW